MPGDIRKLTSTPNGGVFLIEYTRWFPGRGAAAQRLDPGRRGGNWNFAGPLKGQDKPVSTSFFTQQPDPFGHFNYLVKAIESMMHTGHAPYPVERTLLTTGILDALMTSKAEKNRRVETPHLAIKYQPTDCPFATDPVPKVIKRHVSMRSRRVYPAGSSDAAGHADGRIIPYSGGLLMAC